MNTVSAKRASAQKPVRKPAMMTAKKKIGKLEKPVPKKSSVCKIHAYLQDEEATFTLTVSRKPCVGNVLRFPNQMLFVVIREDVQKDFVIRPMPEGANLLVSSQEQKEPFVRKNATLFSIAVTAIA